MEMQASRGRLRSAGAQGHRLRDTAFLQKGPESSPLWKEAKCLFLTLGGQETGLQSSRVSGSLCSSLKSMRTNWELVVHAVQAPKEFLHGRDGLGVLALRPKIVPLRWKSFPTTHLNFSLHLCGCEEEWPTATQREGCNVARLPAPVKAASVLPGGKTSSFWTPFPSGPQKLPWDLLGKPSNKQKWMKFLGPKLWGRTGWLMKPGAGTVLGPSHHTAPGGLLFWAVLMSLKLLALGRWFVQGAPTVLFRQGEGHQLLRRGWVRK